MNVVQRAGIALAAGGLYFAAFPPLDWAACGFAAVALLCVAVDGARPRHAFLLGWLAGTAACTALTSTSIHAAASRYFDQSGWVDAAIAVILPQLYGAPYFGLFTLTVALLERGRLPPLVRMLVVPAAWVTWEYVRASVGDGAPWVLLGHSQHRHLWLLQIADATGAFGVSFVVALVNILLLATVDLVRRRAAASQRVIAVACGALILGAVLAYGARQERRWENPVGASLRVALVQGNIPPAWRAAIGALPDSLKRLTVLTREVAPQLPDLVVWPENAIGFAAAADSAVFANIGSQLPGGAHLLLGAPRAVQESPGHVVFHNSAFLIDSAGGIEATYDKRRLTPFAETAPFGIASLLRQRFARSDIYAPGAAAELFNIHSWRFGVLICFEAIYPDLARDLVRQGATFLVNISNDDWFGEHAALEQHLHAALFRAVEQRRFLVRATNTGLSAVIAPDGKVITALPRGEAAATVATVTPQTALTIYTRFGDWWAWSCAAATAFALATSRLGRRVRQ